MGALAGAGAALGAVGSVFGGIQAEKAGREEAAETMKATKKEAKRKREELEKFKGRQTMSFLQSGVLLEGSPLLVLEETEREGGEEIREGIEGGFRRAESQRRAGRDALIRGLMQGAGSAISAGSRFQAGSTTRGRA